MNKYKKMLFNLFLGVASCLFLIGIAMPSMSINSTNEFASQRENIVHYQQEAKAALLAQQTLIAQQPEFTIKTFAAVLTGEAIVPRPVSTGATGAVGVALINNRLVVRGDFSNLSSGLRDYATDPLTPPNPNITSGIHIHRGTPQENGPFQYALQVELMADGLNGRVRGEYTLSEEQIQALNSGNLYIDLHTKAYRAGELRGVLKSYK